MLERFLHRVKLGASAHWEPHLAECPECRARLDQMRAEDAAYQDRPVAQRLRETLLADRAKQLANAPRRLVRRLGVLLFPAAAVVSAALLWPQAASNGPLTAKGGGLEVTVQRGATAEPLGSMPLQAGDLLQLSWSSTSGGYVAIFAREADGRVEQIYPRADRAAPVPIGSHQPLGGSLKVDGKRLVLHAFFAPDPFPLADLKGPLDRGEIPSIKGQHRILELPGTVAP